VAFKDFSALIDDYLPQRDDLGGRDEPDNGAGAVRGGMRLADARKLPIQARLDLHGQTAEQARQSVDRFLKQCATRDVVKVLIIHGKGTGTLRQEIRRYLEGHPLAGHREPAPRTDGGEGAMVVVIRRRHRNDPAGA
jgi:DNA-nicking Smr family endonuclease